MAIITVDGFDRTALSRLLMSDDIEPGSKPSYETCRTIYTSHPLGAKMAEAPITEAQTEQRTITVDDAPAEVVEVFLKEAEDLDEDGNVHNVHSLSRVYGIASISLGCEGKPADKPLKMEEVWRLPIFFNVLDPLNTAGSLVLNQIPTAPDFNKPTQVTTNGQTFHGSRARVVMNEKPVYLEYTSSAFGFVGRSVYQRALFPLKSFIRSMVADDMMQTKLGLLISKQEQAGSVADRIMAAVTNIKNALLKKAQTGNVLSVGIEESIETLNMQNVDGAGTYSRSNILKNIATAGDMPAILLENETLVEGFGEGTEDARRIVRYLNGIRRKLNPTYRWMDNVIQYRAWSPEFFERMQGKYSQYKGRDYLDVFSEWRQNFNAQWPSLLVESEAEKVQTEKVKFEAIISYLQVMLPLVDPVNKRILLQWAADEVGENKLIFRHALTLDFDELEVFLAAKQEREDEQADAALEGGFGGGDAGKSEGKLKQAGLNPPKVHRLSRPGA